MIDCARCVGKCAASGILPNMQINEHPSTTTTYKTKNQKTQNQLNQNK